jgi:hypothetical protein
MWYQGSMKTMRGLGPLACITVCATAVLACGALRQNLRNQFVSYRGTWACEKSGCEEAQMKRSTKNHREGDVNVTHARPRPAVAMVFHPGTPVDSMTASVECGGQRAGVPAQSIKGPGTHGIGGESDSWVVRLDPADYEMKGCKVWRVTTHATWSDGSTYDEIAGVKVE